MNDQDPKREPTAIPPLADTSGSAISERELNKIDVCRHLLPDPGPEVAGQLITEVRRLRFALTRIERGEPAVVGLRDEFYGHAQAIARDALSPNNRIE